MKFEYIVQDELDILENRSIQEKQNFKDPIKITIKITIERTRYESVKKRRKTPLPEYIKDIFKPCK